MHGRDDDGCTFGGWVKGHREALGIRAGVALGSENNRDSVALLVAELDRVKTTLNTGLEICRQTWRGQKIKFKRRNSQATPPPNQSARQATTSKPESRGHRT